MAGYADNNATSSSTKFSPFFYNKGSYPRMSFDTDNSSPQTARDIAQGMATCLKQARTNMQTSQEAVTRSVNKHRPASDIHSGDHVMLNAKDLKTDRPPKLDDRRVGPFEVPGDFVLGGKFLWQDDAS